MPTENKINCPALHQRSDSYPYGDRVPRTVKMLKTVTADPMPGIGLAYIKGDAPVAKEGQTYPVWTNSHGAVTAVMGDGMRLGLRPAEFEVESWHHLAAEQAHPEPIAWMVGTAFWWTKEEAERDAAETGLPIVGLGPITVAASGEQHQDTPVGEVVAFSEGLHEIAWAAGRMPRLGAKLWTHADPVEVERLRDALRLAKHWCDAALNAIQMGSGNPDALNDVACLLRHMAKDLDSTAPASAEPSAPVEIDDRAGFEAYALDKGWLSQHLKQRPDGNYEDWGVNPEWQAWKARAALERKPQVKS
ncbi:hypothetical protein [Pseudomonas juntendi]